ncbi:MAG: hypothetical protein E7655_01615 [Ruminococcaceae bacterium]|nr:hypothetical protein [Oscillospiraceae bacterium]
MTICLLHRESAAPAKKAAGERTLYRFSLDRSFAYICADVKKRESFLSVLACLTDDRQEIRYRQEILKDFQKNPSLLEQLISLTDRFEALKESQKSAGREEYRMQSERTASSLASKNILQLQAISFKRALLFVKAYSDLLSACDLQSEGLLAFLEECKLMADSPAFEKLIVFCSKYERFSQNDFWDFKISLNEDGRLCACESIDHRFVRISDPDQKKKGISLFKRKEEESFPCARVYPDKDGLLEELSVAAFSDLSRLFESLSEQVFEAFAFLAEDLVFYDVAIAYLNALQKKNISFSYPRFTDSGEISVSKLYDLHLLMSKPNPSEVVPNDFALSEKAGGLLLFGGNGSGKTSYLRSIGTMQILAQAGLPIPCERAALPLVSQIATQFSEAEKEFCEGNDAGRFEQEVRELAAMVESLQEGALVFLNETFQSTAYEEGTEGLYHILNYFSAQNIRWILVSHLTQLERYVQKNEADIRYIKHFEVC